MKEALRETEQGIQAIGSHWEQMMSAHRQSLGLAGASQGVSRASRGSIFLLPLYLYCHDISKLLFWRTGELLIPEAAARRKTGCI